MRPYVLAMVSCLVFPLPVAAVAQQSQADQTMGRTFAAPAAQQVTCRYIYHEGMLIGRRDCHTQQEWNHIRFETQKEVSDFQMRGLTTPAR